MKLHFLNLDNDLALAAFAPAFVPPQSVRQMLADLCVLPAWWADAEDSVLVADVARAQAFARQCGGLMPPVRFLAATEIAEADEICPWGWNAHLIRRLAAQGVRTEQMPSPEQMAAMRQLSNRQTAARLLQTMVKDEDTAEINGFPLCGRAEACRTEAEIAYWVRRWPRTLLKAPWSGSGKGLRQGQGIYSTPLAGWCRRTLATQGCVMVEPLCRRVQDFALEFQADGYGRISYLGLSLFATSARGSYEGNLVASETEKEARLAQYLSPATLHALTEKMGSLLAEEIGTTYRGALGVDMMVCQTQRGLAVHPCVEINLRQTMGHVTLRLVHLLPAGVTSATFSIVRQPARSCLLLTPWHEKAQFAAILEW